jgi:hypothetical protein
MNRTEVIDLLSVIVAYDNRNADDEATIAAFLDAATLGRWTYPEAERAARDWLNANPDGWLRPGHITQLLRQRRRDALEHAAVPTQTPHPDLQRQIEALADRKAVDTDDGRRAITPRAVTPKAITAGQHRIGAAIRRGERARAQHADDPTAPRAAAEGADCRYDDVARWRP